MTQLTDVWTKSSRSNGTNNCVEARRDGDDVLVRDSKLGEDSPILRFNPQEWTAFLAGAQGGEFTI